MVGGNMKFSDKLGANARKLSMLIHSGLEFRKGNVSTAETMIFKNRIEVNEMLAFLIGYSKPSNGTIDSDEFNRIMSLPSNSAELRTKVEEILVSGNIGTKPKENNFKPLQEESTFNSVW
jgi:hypothetical protein